MNLSDSAPANAAVEPQRGSAPSSRDVILDAWRGVSVLLVILYHAVNYHFSQQFESAAAGTLEWKLDALAPLSFYVKRALFVVVPTSASWASSSSSLSADTSSQHCCFGKGNANAGSHYALSTFGAHSESCLLCCCSSRSQQSRRYPVLCTSPQKVSCSEWGSYATPGSEVVSFSLATSGLWR